MDSRHSGEPIQLLNLNPSSRKLELNTKKLEELLLDDRLKNVELSIVSIAGAFRKGKSFMLSFFLRFLNFYYRNNNSVQNKNNEWLSDKNSRLSGFAWRGGCDRHTTGIWIWSKIFTKTMPNGQQIGVILMDTQGMFDNQSDMHQNVTIFALSTMLSSIQVFNLFNQIQEDDLQHLQLFSEYGRIAMENQDPDSKPFQQILFLIRDWNFPADYSYGLMNGNRLLKEKVLKIRPDSPPGIIAVREHLESCFKESSCFLMPCPGEQVRTNKDFDGRLCDIKPEFIHHLNDLVWYLLKPDNICRNGLKQINGTQIKPREFYILLQQYWGVFKSGKIPEAKNILEASTVAICLSAKSDIMQWYFRMITDFSESSDIDTPHLLNCHKNLVTEALKMYDGRVVMGDQQTRRQYRQELANALQENLTYFLGVLQSRQSKSFQETIEKLSAEINELQRRSNDNPSELILMVQKQLQDFMKISHEQQMKMIMNMQEKFLKSNRQPEPSQTNRPNQPNKPSNSWFGSACSIM